MDLILEPIKHSVMSVFTRLLKHRASLVGIFDDRAQEGHNLTNNIKFHCFQFLWCDDGLIQIGALKLNDECLELLREGCHALSLEDLIDRRMISDL